MRILVIMLFLAIPVLSFTQSPIGVWKTVDDTDGEAKSHIEIYEVDNALYGKVIALLPAATVTHCSKCSPPNKNKPLVDMVILHDMIPDGDKWDGGRILDPAKGKEYRCQISLEDSNTLKVRGYIGQPLFGRTQYWYRVN